MTKEDYLQTITKPVDKMTVKALAKKSVRNHESCKNVIDLCFHKVDEIAFRASWVLEHIALLQPDAITAHAAHFLNSYQQQTNYSCKRHFARVLMLLLKQNKITLNNEELNSVIDTTFEWLIDPKTRVAVRVNCLDILFYLKDQSDWIKEELLSQIEFLLKEGTAAMQSRGRKILKQLTTV